MIEKRNIILIAIDTLRADRLGCYGYKRNTSPNIDKIMASDGVVFDNCISPGIPTHPGFTTISTGLHPLRHKIVCHAGKVQLENAIITLPEVLYENGYATAAVDNLTTTGAPWFNRGYEYYLYPGKYIEMRGEEKINGELVTRKTLDFLEWWRQGKVGSRPFFLFVHHWDPHAPYLPPKGFRETFYEGGKTRLKPLLERTRWGHVLLGDWLGRLIDEGYDTKEYIDSLYDDEILYSDYHVAKIFEKLKDVGEFDNTLVMLTSDHGEGLGDNGIFYDHHGLYDWNVAVPLILRLPGVIPRGQRVRDLASNECLMPTVLDVLGIGPGAVGNGVSLLPMMKGKGGRNSVICLENTRMTKRAIRTSRWKMIQTIRPDIYGNPAGHLELYDLSSSEKESVNVLEGNEAVARTLVYELETDYRGMVEDGQDPLITQPLGLPVPAPRAALLKSILGL